MTLRLRRKRRITPPSTTWRNRTSRGALPRGGRPGLAGAGLALVPLLFGISWCGGAAAGDLNWGPPSGAQSQSTPWRDAEATSSAPNSGAAPRQPLRLAQADGSSQSILKRTEEEPFDPFAESDADAGVSIDLGAPTEPYRQTVSKQSTEFDPFEEDTSVDVDFGGSSPGAATSTDANPVGDASDDYFDDDVMDLFDDPANQATDEGDGEPPIEPAVEPEPDVQPEPAQDDDDAAEQPEQRATPPEFEQVQPDKGPRDGEFQTPLPQVDETPPPSTAAPTTTPPTSPQPRRPYSLDSSNLGIGDDLNYGLTAEDVEEAERTQIEQDRRAKQQQCEELRRQIAADRIDTISLDISLKGVAGKHYPFSCGLGEQPFRGRRWDQVTFMWKASGLCHKPLYFEQVQLERYGHSWGPYVQPIISGAHFFATFPVLPYKMGIQAPNECVYTLGYYRPGNCAPYMIDAVPFTWRAAAFEAGAWVGGAAAIP